LGPSRYYYQVLQRSVFALIAAQRHQVCSTLPFVDGEPLPEQRDKAVELLIIIFNTQMMLELPRQRSNTRVLPGSKQ
uniref:Uncharacterized protein n=1 Tax=Romanomermis culicivorax TaxID=13658 RepID=A0A915KSQ2_ROMCU